MNIAQIAETLDKSFEGHRIVFWNDADSEFTDSVNEIVPTGVEILRVDEKGALAAKILIEIEKPNQKFLVYSPTAQTASESDWLLDVRLYSKNFTADAASLLLNELALQTQALREFLRQRKLFFNSKDRRQRLKHWVQPEDQEKDLNKKMIAVVVRADQPEPFAILLKLFDDLTNVADENEESLQAVESDIWKDLEKFDLTQAFWNLVNETFGYESAAPSLYNLLVHLFVTDFANHAKDKMPGKLGSLVLGSRPGAFNTSVFLAQWRANTFHQENYRKISRDVEARINAKDWIDAVPPEKLNECETFEICERRIMRDLRDRLLEPLPAETTDWQNLIIARRNRFWCLGEGNSYLAVYDALLAALEFYRLREQYRDGFSFPNAEAVFSAYTQELYKFDQYYRLFCEASREVKFEGWDVLKPLTEGIENNYGNWFLEILGMNWGKCVEHEDLFKKWRIGGATNQYKFFSSFVQPLARESSDRKVYVIISDAFRFECAEELTAALNTEARKRGTALLEAKLEAMLGVVPSYTALGMASLLPHEKLDYKSANPNADILYTDGISTAGLSNRASVLNKFNGTAIKSEDFMSLGKGDGRDFVRDRQIIYIYHNVIDAVGDSQSTENDTFMAVRQTLNELSQMVSYIFNSLNGSRIFITSDHGFLFQENAPVQLDKSSLKVKSGEALKRKKRYVINPKIDGQANAWSGKIRNTAGIEGDMEFLIPKGANRFHFSGGARFVHGGAMPQEICVPLITIKKLRGQAAEKAAVTRVNVVLLGNLTRIVNNVHRFEFIQTESVSERNLARTLHVSLQNSQGEIISNEVAITFDSISDSMEDRKKTAQLTLRTGNYSRTEQYFLVLTDNEAVVKEYLRMPIIIDIAFSSDF